MPSSTPQQVNPMIHEFTLTLVADDLTIEMADALFAAGCDDASPWSEGSTVYASFDREAESREAAISSAIACVAKAGYAVRSVGDFPEG